MVMMQEQTSKLGVSGEEEEILTNHFVTYFGYFGMFEESPQLSTSGSARLLVTIQSNKLLLLAAM